jgi:hypothetical protein
MHLAPGDLKKGLTRFRQRYTFRIAIPKGGLQFFLSCAPILLFSASYGAKAYRLMPACVLFRAGFGKAESWVPKPANQYPRVGFMTVSLGAIPVQDFLNWKS